MAYSQGDVAWLAGLYEGEGCAYIAKNGATRIDISSTDRDVLEKIDSIFSSPCQISSSQPKPAKAGYGIPKIRYGWRLGRPEQVREFLELILPHLCKRRKAKALEVLQHLDTRPGTGGHNKNKTQCAKGHPYTPENTRIRAGTTYRRCIACQTEWSQANKERERRLSE